MPADKRSKEETWTEAELLSSLKDNGKDRKSKPKDGKSRTEGSRDKDKKPRDSARKSEDPALNERSPKASRKDRDSEGVGTSKRKEGAERKPQVASSPKVARDAASSGSKAGSSRRSDGETRRVKGEDGKKPATKDGGDRKSKDGEDRKSKDGGDRKSKDSGDRKSKDSGDRKSKDSGDRKSKDSGDSIKSSTKDDVGKRKSTSKEDGVERRGKEDRDKRKSSSTKDERGGKQRKGDGDDRKKRTGGGEEEGGRRRRDKDGDAEEGRRRHRDKDDERGDKNGEDEAEGSSDKISSSSRGDLQERKSVAFKVDDEDSGSSDRIKKREKEMMEALTTNQNKPDKEEEEEEEEDNYDDEDFDDYDDDFDDFEDDDTNQAQDNDDESEKSTRTGTGSMQPATSAASDDDDDDDDDDKENSDGGQKIERFKSKLNLHLSQSEQKGVDEVLLAINAENSRVASSSSSSNSKSSSRPNSDTSTPESRTPKKSPILPIKKVFGKINFVAAKQKELSEKTAQKTRKRGQELMSLIQLDTRSLDLFELAPLTEYELYMKRFGASDSQQAYCQTHEDNSHEEVQTEEIEMESRWCQHTYDIQAAGVGDEATSVAGLASSDTIGLADTDASKLSQFVGAAGQLCALLLDEISAGIGQPIRGQYSESSNELSDGFVTLASHEFIVHGREFSHTSYSPTQTNLLLTAYGSSQVKETETKLSPGVVCVWNTNEPIKPSKILCCEAIPKCCCFNPGKPMLVFAGMEDGVLAVWDLRETDSQHESRQMVGNETATLRSATFTTAPMHGSDGHTSCIIALSTISAQKPRDVSNADDIQENIGLSFQIASLDESGMINIWNIVEVTRTIETTDINSDLGLSPLGQVKLEKSGSISLSAAPRLAVVNSTCMQVHPRRLNEFFIGTKQGDVLHVIRFRKNTVSRTFKSPTESCIVALDISPCQVPCLLTCSEDSTVRLYNLSKDESIFEWHTFSEGARLVDVRWSRSRPNVFYVMDDQSVFYVWDLLQDEVVPVLKQKVQRKDKRAIGFDLTNDFASMGIGSIGRGAEMVFTFGDGSVEVHRLSKKFSTLSGDELDRMISLVDEIT